ncbi:MAG: redox-sensing transcriptional repressor Rex [Treponema sp.]|jgi:redox-sensing transcriptional repressor|nr:redox-sensing transcriptional repressor Rex [Treponema sp.]
MTKQKIASAPSIRRLPSYLHIIRLFQREGEEYISGTFIGQKLNLDPIQVRKDLGITGVAGKPKKGYPVEELISAIECFLGWNRTRNAVLVGVGNLGSALLGYQELKRHGLNILAAFDKNPEKTGGTVHGTPVLSVDAMETEILRLGVTTAILTIPSSFAQEIADILIKAGIRGIWNFTNVKLKVPDGVMVQKEDISSGYAMFCIMLHD